MTLATTARTLREDARARLSRLLRRTSDQLDLTQEALSRQTGAASSIVGRWFDHNHPALPSLADLGQMPRALALVLLRWACREVGEDLDVVELPQADAGCRDDYRLCATATREHGELLGALLEAVADGTMDHIEGAKIESECDDVIAIVLAIRERARMAQRERVIGLVRSAS